MEKQTKKRLIGARSERKVVHINRPEMNLKTNLITKYSHLILLISLATICLIVSELAHGDSVSPQPAVISSRAAFLRAQRASRQQAAAATSSTPSNQTAAQSSTSSPNTNTSSSNNSRSASSSINPASNQPIVIQSAASTSKPPVASGPSKKQSSEPSPSPRLINSSPALQANSQQQQPAHSNNRSTRTADVFQNGDGYNIFVTNTCEREQMSVNIRMSRPFFGVIHTKNERNKSICVVEGNGNTEYNMEISHILNQQDDNYCGVIKARRVSPEDKDLLSVVIAVRVHPNIELSDDKFFLLNCTNRCRRPDCSNPSAPNASGQNNKLLQSPGSNTNARVIADEIPDITSGGRERESVTPSTGRPGETGAGGQQDSLGKPKPGDEDECTIWKFPWLITLLWCMGILLLAMIISHCIMCSSLVCRCVRTEVEEREPSVYEDDETDDEDNLYNKKNHPMRIDYDNRDIYKTSNNYEPYNLDEVQSNSRARKSGSGEKSTKSYRNR